MSTNYFHELINTLNEQLTLDDDGLGLALLLLAAHCAKDHPWFDGVTAKRIHPAMIGMLKGKQTKDVAEIEIWTLHGTLKLGIGIKSRNVWVRDPGSRRMTEIAATAGVTYGQLHSCHGVINARDLRQLFHYMTTNNRRLPLPNAPIIPLTKQGTPIDLMGVTPPGPTPRDLLVSGMMVESELGRSELQPVPLFIHTQLVLGVLNNDLFKRLAELHLIRKSGSILFLGLGHAIVCDVAASSAELIPIRFRINAQFGTLFIRYSYDNKTFSVIAEDVVGEMRASAIKACVTLRHPRQEELLPRIYRLLNGNGDFDA